MIHSVVLKILSKCNWNCKYCDNTSNMIVPINEVIYYINILQKYNPDINISISGGEPGLLSKEYLADIFNASNNPVEVATNGLFLKNNYHKIFKDKIKNISYHVIEDIDDNLKVNIIKINNIESNNILVIHKLNYKKALPFLLNNPNFIFDLKFYIGDDLKYILNISDIKYLHNILDINITDKSKLKIKLFSDYKKINQVKKSQEICRKRIYIPRIDLVNKKIYRCCAGNTNAVDVSILNEKVLKIMFNHNSFPCVKKNICTTCYHNFILNINKEK